MCSKPIPEYNKSICTNKCDYPKDKTIISIFEKQVKQHPNKIAVVFNSQKITYKELNTRANKLAVLLQKHGVCNNNLVGLVSNRSIEMVISIISILKTGGAYLPIDIDFPEERIRYIIKNSGTSLLLSTIDEQKEYFNDLPVIHIDQSDEIDENNQIIQSRAKSTDLCYAIYTSGTTGKPKGVMIENKNVVRLLFNSKFQFNFDDSDIWTMFHSHCFDFSVWEIFGALLYGGKLVIVPKITAKDSKEFLQLLHDEEITVLNQTPSAFYNLIEQDSVLLNSDLKLKYVIFGGEALSPVKLKEWYKLYPQIELINMYGITETTVHVTFKKIGETEINNNISNIGKPIPTLSIYLFDEYMNLVDFGEEGEIYVAGEGLARGYLGNESLTNQRFIKNPFNKQERLYKTGDLARFLTSGDLEYIGRKDQQIQLRGFRIELSEIESILYKYDKIKSCVVTDKENKNGDKYLCAYIISDVKIPTSELRDFLANWLPEYMIPSYFVYLENIPLTSNGKVDKNRLPKPNKELFTGNTYIAPRNKDEEKLIHICEMLLDISNVSSSDKYFEIGGNSINAVQFINEIYREFNAEISVQSLYEKQKLSRIYDYILDKKETSEQKYQGKKENKYFLAVDFQNKLFLAQMFSPSNTSWNISQFFRLEGDIDIDRFNNAFKRLLTEHENLRASFSFKDRNVYCHIQDEIDTNIEFIQTEKDLNELIRLYRKPFKLGSPGLIRLYIFSTKSGSKFMFLDIHHIICDGYSIKIILKDLIKFYDLADISSKKYSISEFIKGEKRHCNSTDYKIREENWCSKFKHTHTKLNLPYSGTNNNNIKGARRQFNLVKNELNCEPDHIFQILISGYILLLHEICNQDEICIGVPFLNRNFPGTDEIVHCITNVLLFNIRLTPNLAISDFNSLVNKKIEACILNQDIRYESFFNRVNDFEKNKKGLLLYDTFFNYEKIERKYVGKSFIAYPELVEVPDENLPLSVDIFENDVDIIINFKYKSELFNEIIIYQYLTRYVEILQILTEEVAVTINDIFDKSPLRKQPVLSTQTNR